MTGTLLNQSSITCSLQKNYSDYKPLFSPWSSKVLPSKVEGIALCAGFILSFVFIVVGNLLVIVLFAVNRRLRKRCLLLVINMAFADLMLGNLTLPIYIYRVGKSFQLWNGGSSMPMLFFYLIADTFFSQASLISAALLLMENRKKVVVGKGVDKYHFFQGGLNPRNNALNSGSQPGFDPSLSALFRGFCAPLEKVVFVDSFPYYSRR